MFRRDTMRGRRLVAMVDALSEDERRELARLLVEGARLVLAQRRGEQPVALPEPEPQATPPSASVSSRSEPR
jgi:hypothetical protein